VQAEAAAGGDDDVAIVEGIGQFRQGHRSGGLRPGRGLRGISCRAPRAGAPR
jgi:hypothetical protein